MWFKQKGWYLTGGFDRHFDNAIKKGQCGDASGKKLRYVRGIAWKGPGDWLIGRYDHRKVWIVDGEVAYIGGYTVSDEMRENMYDAEWVLRGPVVAQLQANFLLSMAYSKAPLADFAACRSELKGGACPGVSSEQVSRVLDAYFPPAGSGPGYAKALTIVQNNALLPKDPDALGVTRFYKHLIGTASENLELSSPFFTSDDIVARVLDRYRESGCELKVDVLFPKRPEHMMIWGKKGRKEMARLLAETQSIRASACGGVGEDLVIKEFRGDGACSDYGKRGRLHGKVLLSEKYVSIGSTNLDGVSLERNLELNVVSEDPGLIARVNRDFFRWGGSDVCGETLPPAKGGSIRSMSAPEPGVHTATGP
jgi:phosphatidylserine/phosphatidylglycerophosphate/cardiolipin synthase-like enzyme